MKKATLILGVLLVTFGAFAQVDSNVKQSDLKGPAYKNYKAWMHKTAPAKIYSDNNKEALQGPAFKNNQHWNDTANKDLVVVNTVSDDRQKLTGPAFKNNGPWSKK